VTDGLRRREYLSMVGAGLTGVITGCIGGHDLYVRRWEFTRGYWTQEDVWTFDAVVVNGGDQPERYVELHGSSEGYGSFKVDSGVFGVLDPGEEWEIEHPLMDLHLPPNNVEIELYTSPQY